VKRLEDKLTSPQTRGDLTEEVEDGEAHEVELHIGRRILAAIFSLRPHAGVRSQRIVWEKGDGAAPAA